MALGVDLEGEHQDSTFTFPSPLVTAMDDVVHYYADCGISNSQPHAELTQQDTTQDTTQVGSEEDEILLSQRHSEYFTVSQRREHTINEGRASSGVLVSEMVAEFVVTSYSLSAHLDATRQQNNQKVKLCLHETLLTVDIQMIPLQEIPIPPPNWYESLHSCGEYAMLNFTTSNRFVLTGPGFASNNKYLFGNINMQMKLVSGDSAGTTTSYYVGF
ncbi:hypothetical protein SUGI_0719130 [Cryptomeria japonica]|nr:hypothetical protein SUGI_0719130 [Cryptomeria japonica]